MKISPKLFCLTLLCLLMLSLYFISVKETTAQTEQATSLQAANDAVNQAFNAVLDAEKSGANVTDLLTQINNAQNILAQSENHYRIGDTNAATAEADSVLPITQQVINSAKDAEQNAIVSSQNAFWITIALTLVGIFLFVLVLFLIWRLVKQHYIKGLSEAKPEVVNQ
jgi:CHASE3 domain sensor protein